jgi:hypothetical protein
LNTYKKFISPYTIYLNAFALLSFKFSNN